MNSVPSPPKELKHTHAQKHTHTHTHQQQTTDNGVCCQIHITHCLIPSCCLIAAGVSMRSGPQRCSQHATLDQSLRNSLIPKSITFSLFHTFSDTFQNRKGKSNPRCGWFAALPIHPTQLSPHTCCFCDSLCRCWKRQAEHELLSSRAAVYAACVRHTLSQGGPQQHNGSRHAAGAATTTQQRKMMQTSRTSKRDPSLAGQSPCRR